MNDETIELHDEIAALRATINRAHFYIYKGFPVTALGILGKALVVGDEEE